MRLTVISNINFGIFKSHKVKRLGREKLDIKEGSLKGKKFTIFREATDGKVNVKAYLVEGKGHALKHLSNGHTIFKINRII